MTVSPIPQVFIYYYLLNVSLLVIVISGFLLKQLYDNEKCTFKMKVH